MGDSTPIISFVQLIFCFGCCSWVAGRHLGIDMAGNARRDQNICGVTTTKRKYSFEMIINQDSFD